MALPELVPPLPRPIDLNRRLPPSTAKEWLAAGWRDFQADPMSGSIAYGVLIFVISQLLIGGLFLFGGDYILLPALGAFMVIGPALATGLYEKSRRLERGEKVTFDDMIGVRTASPGQIFFLGVILLMLILLWMRAAVLLYALFFGKHAFPGIGEVVGVLLTTSEGWGLLFVGSLFGALFAALGFSISVFSVPMLLDERTGAFSAMGASITLVSRNLPVMLAWGAIVFVIFLFCLATMLIGLIVAYPVLGHATWHAYKAIRGERNSPIMVAALPDEMPKTAHSNEANY